MLPKVSKIAELKQKITTAVLISSTAQISDSIFPSVDKDYITTKLNAGEDCTIRIHPHILFIHKIKEEPQFKLAEDSRKAGADFFDMLKKEKIRSVQLADFSSQNFLSFFLEGMLLSGYSFSKYKKEKDDFNLDEISVPENLIGDDIIHELKVLTEAVFKARDLVNEPLSFLTAERFSEEIKAMGSEAGFNVEVFHKKKIEALRMGGLLAVNRGSPDPPTFSILEWKPEGVKDLNPLILAGKGVVFDTGGLSLKPTPKSMDYMKSDMGGGAVVAAVVYAAAKLKLPLHIIGLIPATDNRPDGNAYVPGDIITMYDGTTVEIKNTDAEGRLILADALSYAKKFDPCLVIDVATLTGSAAMITGPYGLAAMGNSQENLQKLRQSGEETYERVVELPLWEEFSKSLKSPVADLNNLGEREGQTSTAGKFLEHFTDYPWLHLDIAGVAFYNEKSYYNPAGGTGFGIRLLYNFLKRFN
ncbi:MAG: leucyl aminopeptidase family protein [Prolixibacteraceae bacterium]|nr:leucyl aminopeptidase family protein [Prolixibacteraceae bacterium]